MECAQEMDEDLDSDVSNIIPLRDELQKCSDILAEESTSTNEFFQSVSNIVHVDQPNVSLPSCSKTYVNLPSSSKTDKFSKEDIPLIPKEQEDELLGLGVSVYDQTEFENEVIGQVDKALKAQEEQKRKTDLQRELKTVAEDIRYAKQMLSHIDKALSMVPKDSMSVSNAAKRELAAIKKEQENKLKHLKKLEAKQKTLQAFVSGNAEEAENAVQDNFEGEEEMDEETLYHLKNVFSSKETEEERLIRMGQMTPFGTVMQNRSPAKPKPRTIIVPEDQLTDFDKFLLNEAEAHKNKKSLKPAHKHPKPSTSKCSEMNFMTEKPSNLPAFTDVKAVVRKKQKVKVKLGSKHANGYLKKVNLNKGLVKNYKSDSEVSDFELEDYNDEESFNTSDDEYRPDHDIDDDDDYEIQERKPKKMRTGSRKKSNLSSEESESCLKSVRSKAKKIVDDGDQESYIKRIKAFEKSELIKKHEKILESADGVIDSDDEDFTEFEGDYKIPNSVWNKLYKYQQTGVRWLWELHQQNCGGIIGDEMGLGKTIQVIAFLIGLKYSKLLTVGDNFRGLGPVILVCPATVMHQWVKEFHTWWPPFRVAILHESGSFVGKKELLIRAITKNHGILITSYAGIVQHQECLLNHEWHYIILDEGHKIRNPDAQATLTVKQFRTPHRIILSGSPVQNNLKELWSLFDFIFPGKLGTLPIFMQQFSVPIVQGGYANASKIQVQTAYKCATVLRDSIKPYLLRRMKSDVKMSINLPNKSEQVLFCQLTEEQANLYKAYISSKEVDSILNARLQVFVGLINLRKICNHPDIFDGGPKIFKDTDVSSLTEEEQYGYYKRSGKMIVVEALLRLWHKQGHRVLLFTQSRQMMEILEIFVKSKNYTYMKMDGTSSISSRQPAINKFNSNPSIFVFLLTTRVGGLGVNLTGADRVIIYDPDWNPSTDAQARERAWRIGQEKQVTIYRLLTAGTIEEKIYHRQIFKQFVTNRVLKDPRQRRFFKSNDLYELFTFNEVGPQGTETSAIFAGTGSEVKIPKKSHKQAPETGKESAVQVTKERKGTVSFSPEKLEQMKQLAKKLSLELSKKNSSNEKVVNPSAEQGTSQTSQVSVAENPSTKQDTGQISRIFVAERKSADVKCISKEKIAKKGRKRKPAKVDGEKIDYVVKTDIYKPPRTEEEENAKQDDYVLSKLFKKSGVYTALKHDTIVEASDPDYMIMEGEAEKVAKQAIKALKESRRMCARASEGIPTWTGQHGGVKPRFGQKKKILPFTEIGQSDNSDTTLKSPMKVSGKKSTFDGGGAISDNAPSSSDLLSAISERKMVFGTDVASDDEESSVGPTTSKPATQHDELLVDIRNFIAFRAAVDGQATTKEIVEAFRDKLPIQQNAVFKSLLSKICDFSRSSDGDGIWHLKGEFW